jgi:lipoprotein-anchoring transpeptidase ErfK/SrfK
VRRRRTRLSAELAHERERAFRVEARERPVLFRAHVGVGQRRWPTPRGDFYVREKLSGFGDPFYGPIAFGTSGRSAVLTDWPGGGYIGIHGTDEPDLLPGRVSHGCIRLRNADIRRLAALLPLGTPLSVR